jgi:hypothetical protein
LKILTGADSPIKETPGNTLSSITHTALIKKRCVQEIHNISEEITKSIEGQKIISITPFYVSLLRK